LRRTSVVGCPAERVRQCCAHPEGLSVWTAGAPVLRLPHESFAGLQESLRPARAWPLSTARSIGSVPEARNNTQLGRRAVLGTVEVDSHPSAILLGRMDKAPSSCPRIGGRRMALFSSHRKYADRGVRSSARRIPAADRQNQLPSGFLLRITLPARSALSCHRVREESGRIRLPPDSLHHQNLMVIIRSAIT